MQNLPKIEHASGLVTAPTANDPLFDERRTGKYLGDVSERTLQRWRQEGRGPPYFLIGRLVRYRKSDLDRYLDSVFQNHETVCAEAGFSEEAREVAVPVKLASPKRRRPVDSPQLGHCEPTPTAGRGSGSCQPRGNAAMVADHFVAVRSSLWPDAGPIPLIDNLRVEAETILANGVTPSALIEAISHQLGLVAMKERQAPLSLRTILSGAVLAAARGGAATSNA